MDQIVQRTDKTYEEKLKTFAGLLLAEIIALSENQECISMMEAGREIDRYVSLSAVEAMMQSRLNLEQEKEMVKEPVGMLKDVCPSCGTRNSVFSSRRKMGKEDIVYCWHCGQPVRVERKDGEIS